MPPKGSKKNSSVTGIPNRRGKGMHPGIGFTGPMGGALKPPRRSK